MACAMSRRRVVSAVVGAAVSLAAEPSPSPSPTEAPPPPPVVSEQEARAAAGEDAVYYGTRLRGASNAKAKRAFGFAPRRLEWLST